MKCRFCNEKIVKPFLHFEKMPIANNLRKKNQIVDELFDLKIFFCKKCYLTQTEEVKLPKIIFSEISLRSDLEACIRLGWGSCACRLGQLSQAGWPDWDGQPSWPVWVLLYVARREATHIINIPNDCWGAFVFLVVNDFPDEVM